MVNENEMFEMFSIEKMLTLKSFLHSCMRVVRHSWAAFCSWSSRASGTPRFFLGLRGLGLCVTLFVPLMLNKEGAKHTARLLAVIWWSSACVEMSKRKKRRDWRTSRFSSGRSTTADCKASRRCSPGKSTHTHTYKIIIKTHQNKQYIRYWSIVIIKLWTLKSPSRFHEQLTNEDIDEDFRELIGQQALW